MRAERRRATHSLHAAPEIVDAQVREVVKQLLQGTPVNFGAAMLVAWIFAGIPYRLPLFFSCAALMVLTVGALFVLPHMPWQRIRYTDVLKERRALHLHSLMTGMAWGGMMLAPLLSGSR